MANKTIVYSSSLIGNLSIEGESIRLRCKRIVNSIFKCKEQLVVNRLKHELKTLETRRSEILKIAKEINNTSIGNSLSIDLLIEICSRPISPDLYNS